MRLAIYAAGNPWMTGERSVFPATVAGLYSAQRKYGKLAWERVVAPAIALAVDGFSITTDLAKSLKKEVRLASDPEARRNYLKSGDFWKPGEIFRQPELAAVLKRIAERGSDGFYKGETADAIVEAMRRNNGLITATDLSAYTAVSRKPLIGKFRDRYTIVTMPPPSSGGIALLSILNQMETFAPRQFPIDDPQTLHRQLETMRRAFADRAEYLGDPDFVMIPVAELINKAYARRRIADFDSRKATPSANVKAGNIGTATRHESPQTTHYSVADGAGNVVSVTYTLNTAFGAAVVVPGTGILLNNEMDDFAAKPGVPNGYGLIQSAKNKIAPGKRPLSSMTPTIVLDNRQNNRPILVVGSPGGPTIINTVSKSFTPFSNMGYRSKRLSSVPVSISNGCPTRYRPNRMD